VADGKTMVLTEAEYPALQGIKPGATGKLTAGFKVTDATDGSVTIELENCEVETQSRADKDLAEMSEQTSGGTPAPNASAQGDY
jgi:hypothetical protein